MSINAPSLLDESGQLSYLVGPKQEEYWTRRLHDGSAAMAYVPAYHLWLGEARLAHDQQPWQAIQQFRQVELSRVASPKLKDLAAYDIAVAQFYGGAYGDASRSFWDLLTRKPAVTGVDRRRIALWYKYAASCIGFHLEHVDEGIPEPIKLDPYCAVSALAICLRPLHMPYDRDSVAKVCKVTGEGSSLNDVKAACKSLKLNIHVFTADDKGLIQVPKPLIAFVERDHFIAVINANKSGVTYVCSDCGPWPGGQVTLTWKQWHILEPSLYASVQKPGTRNDKILTALETKNIPAIAKVATAGLGHGIIPSSREWINVALALRPHVIFGFKNGNPKCGTKVHSLHCLSFQNCPMVCVCHGAGPSKGDPVDAANGEEEYSPEPDLTVYNPTGPSISWSRVYGSLRGPDAEYESQDFGIGWSHSYNIGVFAPSASNPEGDMIVYNYSGYTTGAMPAIGAESPPFALAPGGGIYYMWDIVGPGSKQIASSRNPLGWNVVTSGSGQSATINVTVPSGTAAGWYRARSWASTPGASISFYVDPVSSSGQAGVSLGLDLGTNEENTTSKPFSSESYQTNFVMMPNGARIQFLVPTGIYTQAGVECIVEPGAPVDVKADYNAGYITDYTITFGDLTQWKTVQNTQANSINGGWYYAIASIGGRAGSPIVLNYTNLAANGSFPLLAYITNSSGSTTLLTIHRNSDDTVNYVSDCYNRSVQYTYTQWSVGGSGTPWNELSTVSTVVTTGTASPPSRYSYNYQEVSNLDGSETAPFLHTITTPSLNNDGTTDTATINYDSTSDYVSSIQDANGVTTTFTTSTPSTNTQVTVSGKGTNYSHTIYYDGLMNETADTDGNGKAIVQYAYADPNDPYQPSQITIGSTADGNGQQWNLTWDTQGHVKSLTTPRGVVYTYVWDTQNDAPYNGQAGSWALPLLTGIYTSGIVSKTSFAYNTRGELTGIAYPLPGTVGGSSLGWISYSHDTLGNLQQIQLLCQYLNGAVVYDYVYFGYSRSDYSEMLGKPATITDNNGKVWNFYYDSTNNYNPIETIDPIGYTTQYGYDLADALTSATGTYLSGNSPSTATLYRSYPGAPAYEAVLKDGSGTQIRQTNWSYGAEGEILGQSGSADPYTVTYDGLYRLATLTDGGGNVTSYFYNSAGYPYQIVYPGATSTPPTQPLASGSLDTITDTSYDSAGNLLTQVDGKGQTTTYQYKDPDGLLSQIAFPTAPTSENLYRDSLGRIDEIDDGSGTVLKYAYDDNDTLTSTSTQYSGWSSPESVSYGLNWDGSRATMTLPSGTYNYSYDADRRLNSITDPFGVTSSWQYYDNGQLQYETLGSSGIQRTYSYSPTNDLVSSLTNHKVSDGSVLADYTNLTYDGADNVTSMTASIPALYGSNTLTQSYSYDTRDRLTQERYSFPTPVSGGCNGTDYISANDSTLGNVGTSDFTASVWVKCPSALSAQQTILSKRSTAGLGSYLSVTIWTNGVVTADISSDSSGTDRITVFGNKNIADNNWHHVAIVRQGTTLSIYVDGALDASGSSTGVANISNSSPLTLGYTVPANNYYLTAFLSEFRLYAYALSQTQISDLAQTGTAVNPPGNCLVYWNFNATTGNTIEDLSGNGKTGQGYPSLPTTTGTVPPQTGYAVNYAYDNGTLTGPGNLTTFGDQSFSYNSDNQIVGYTYDGNGNPASVNGVGLTYDSQNRVTQAGSESISYRADGMRAYQSDSGGVYYLYDGIDPVEMLSRPGYIIADLEYGANGYLGDRESSTTGSLLTYDPLGNTVHYTNYSGGINTTSLPTGAFGTIGGTNVPTRDFGFQHDLNYSYNAASGLEALGARLYDPRSGRFINRDPIGYAGGINVYAYAGSNPVNGMDPWGLFYITVSFSGSGFSPFTTGPTRAGGGIGGGLEGSLLIGDGGVGWSSDVNAGPGIGTLAGSLGIGVGLSSDPLSPGTQTGSATQVNFINGAAKGYVPSSGGIGFSNSSGLSLSGGAAKWGPSKGEAMWLANDQTIGGYVYSWNSVLNYLRSMVHLAPLISDAYPAGNPSCR